MQDALRILSDYWTSRGCLTWQPYNSEVGAGTMNFATVLRVLGELICNLISSIVR